MSGRSGIAALLYALLYAALLASTAAHCRDTGDEAPTDQPRDCGDNTCGIGEDCETCPADCTCKSIYHVARDNPEGCDDSWPGTRQKPFCTIQRAADVVVAGDLVLVHPGDYGERIAVTSSGAPGAPITFRTEGAVKCDGFEVEASHLSIKGFEITTLADENEGVGILVRSGEQVNLEKNDIRYCTMGGIVLGGNPDDPTRTHDCVLRDNRMVRNGLYGAQIKGRNHLIEGNEVLGTIQHHPCMIRYASEPWLDADGFHFHGSGHVFRKNRVLDISYGGSGWDTQAACSLASLQDTGIDYNDAPHIDCFQTFTSSDKEGGTDVLFEQNFCLLPECLPEQSVAGKGFQVGDGASANLVIRNNVIAAHILAMFTESSDLFVANNTFIGGDCGDGAVGIYLTESSNAVIKNNIFAYQENGIGSIWPDGSSIPTLDADYNCLYRRGGEPWGTANPNDVWGLDPLFVAEAAGDFHLQPSSPCRDAGLVLPLVANDFDGTERPQGSGYDMGAFEITP